MALRNISQFKSQLTGGGVRPNLFEVDINFPAAVGSTFEFMSNADTPSAEDVSISSDGLADRFPFMIKAANLPASNITPVEVPFRGRILKVAGERTFDTWTVTVLNDADFQIRTAMEQWMNGISRLSNGSGEVNPSDYTANADVTQLDRNGNPLRKYNFVGLFPTNVSEIALSMDTTDTIEEFTVEFQVLYWNIATGSDSSAYPSLT
ncbi:MAG: hypothetical protein CMA57_03585 [Euryarchaeota archaeon]|jgi:hypothetical protein|nr:hypothetical protein [Euryarchaeota archaeon]|tara:strand:- start:843 stop:1463 length:621 start_codon:yes stop_codon:yes gene_type:complete